jgi:hypothetical protein
MILIATLWQKEHFSTPHMKTILFSDLEVIELNDEGKCGLVIGNDVHLT